MTVDGLGFPQRIEGLEALGDTTFRVGGRRVAAVVFARGQQGLTYERAPGPRYLLELA